MDFTKEQLSEVLCKHAERENGLQDLTQEQFGDIFTTYTANYCSERNNRLLTLTALYIRPLIPSG